VKIFLFILLAFVSLQARPFEDELKSYLQSKLSSYEKFEYQIVPTLSGYKKIEINNDKSFRLVKNYAYVPVRVYDAKNHASTSLLTVKLKLYKTVFVSAQKINLNESLSLSWFDSKLQDVSSFSSALVNEAELTTLRSRVLIKEGAVLTHELVELIPIIYKGEKVIVHAGKNGVDVSIDAVTRQDANAGDIISVQANSKIFKAKVIDKYNLMLVE